MRYTATHTIAAITMIVAVEGLVVVVGESISIYPRDLILHTGGGEAGGAEGE
jgi:hypothetical protein